MKTYQEQHNFVAQLVKFEFSIGDVFMNTAAEDFKTGEIIESLEQVKKIGALALAEHCLNKLENKIGINFKNMYGDDYLKRCKFIQTILTVDEFNTQNITHIETLYVVERTF